MIIYKTLDEMRAVSRGRVGFYDLKETTGKSYIKLYDVVKDRQRNIIRTEGNVYKHVQLSPEKHYAIPPADILEEILSKFKQKRAYSASLEQALKNANIPYEEKRCRTCGGNVLKLEYPTVEVVHGTNKTKGKKNDSEEDSEE